MKKEFLFTSKAQTLKELTGKLKIFKVPEQIDFTVNKWKNSKNLIINKVLSTFPNMKLAIRSSSLEEDQVNQSKAGVYDSYLNIYSDKKKITIAVNKIIKKFIGQPKKNQILIQPMVENVTISGVFMSRDLHYGSPYYSINYDDETGSTDTVTGGSSSKSIFVYRKYFKILKSDRIKKIILAVIELENFLNKTDLDIEFCCDKLNNIYLLQVRPITTTNKFQVCKIKNFSSTINQTYKKIEKILYKKNSLIHGDKTVLSDMSDWNPAEMIGSQPNKLAFSIYKELITNSIWSQARIAMGYKNFGIHPLLVDIKGKPFVDVRKSLNSFLPKGLRKNEYNNIINAQIKKLETNRNFHDKIEFKVSITNASIDLDSRLKILTEYGIDNKTLKKYKEKIIDHTNEILIKNKTSVLRRLDQVKNIDEYSISEDNYIKNIQKLIINCKRNGTLPFSELARHAFIAVDNLKALVNKDVITFDRYNEFIESVDTVAQEITHDINKVNKGTSDISEFLIKHGHLRPGTYNILSPSYKENHNIFLSQANKEKIFKSKKSFKLTVKEINSINKVFLEEGIKIGAEDFFFYAKNSIYAREKSKYIFTKDISSILENCIKWGLKNNLSRNQVAHLSINDILISKNKKYIINKIEKNKYQNTLMQFIKLPNIIITADDAYIIRIPFDQPTYITTKSLVAETYLLENKNLNVLNDTKFLQNKIIIIESADPGYDWLFSCKIKGLITKYGGSNSHMAIRCAEFALPAIIGCGERIFENIKKSYKIDLNCNSKQIKVIL